MAMKTTSHLFATLLFVLFMSTSDLAQTPAPTRIAEPTPSPTGESIEVLKAQRDLMNDYNERILSTVYWSLAGMVGVVAVVIGLGWWTNFRIYRKDIDAIKDQYKNDLESLKSELKKEASATKTEMMQSARAAGQTAVAESISQIKELQLEQLRLAAKKWEEDGYVGNALLEYSRMLPIGLGLSEFLYVPEILGEISRLLKKISARQLTRPEDLIEKLDDLPPKFSTQVDAIKELVKQALLRT